MFYNNMGNYTNLNYRSDKCKLCINQPMCISKELNNKLIECNNLKINFLKFLSSFYVNDDIVEKENTNKYNQYSNEINIHISQLNNDLHFRIYILGEYIVSDNIYINHPIKECMEDKDLYPLYKNSWEINHTDGSSSSFLQKFPLQYKVI